MSIRHLKRVPYNEPPGANIVTADMWHEPHNAPEFLIAALHPKADLYEPSTSLSAIEYDTSTVLGSYPRGFVTLYDFSAIDDVCVEWRSATDSLTLSGELRAQYSRDLGVSWHYFDGLSGPRVDVSSAIHYASILRGAWVPVAEAAKLDALVRFITMRSDGVSIAPGAISLWGR
jgi:hypothetical protein